MKIIFAIAVALTMTSTAFAAGSDDWAKEAAKIAPVSMQDYVAKYPLYLEASALTKDDQLVPGAPACPAKSIDEVKKLSKDDQKKCMQTGGFGGHGITFVRGACIQPGTPTPQLYNCSQDSAVMQDPNSGVGISTNQDFYNVAWVAIPGYKLFYAGDVGPDEKLTLERYQAVIQKIDDLHLYDTITINPKYDNKPLRPVELTSHQYLLLDAIGTDFGSTFRSNVYFARVPISNAQLDAVIAYLNAVNMDFYNRRATETLSWDVILDNCAHTVNNIFAAAGFVHAKETINLGDTEKFPRPGHITAAIEVLKMLVSGNVAIPANTVINIAKQTSKIEIKSVWRTFHNKKLKAKVLAREPMVGPGVIVGANLMHENNDMFTYGGPGFVASLPSFIPTPVMNANRVRKKLYGEERLTVLEANRRFYVDAIQKLLVKAEREMKGVDDGQFAELNDFYKNQYRPYLEGELARLNLLGSGQAPTP